ncbi:MAG: nucleotidyl transferase AbiEii/AbiGii toxin family protein [Chloroflexi bacterium]|nr:nucleotidyl transferase AbiEii/AbiGii toxin family protein [Chloroflexota bacterium]
MEITTRAIRTWADEYDVPDLTLAELDYRLVHALQAIYADPFLRARLYLKGGTALNKFYIPNQGRLSVDLDFNVVGPRDQVLEERTQFSQRVMRVLGKQDSSYDFTYRWRYEQATVYARYTPLTGVAQQRLKVEISFTERVAIMDREEQILPGSLFGYPVVVNTYHLEELTSTKLRALHDRRKGRDIYDLFHIAEFDLNRAAVRKMVLYYFYRAKKVFNYPSFVNNIEQKIARRSFRDDVRGLIRQGSSLDWSAACERVLDYFAFLEELDDRDHLFLDLAKRLLHKPYPKASEEIIKGIKYPLAWLMEGVPISDEAATLDQEDIEIYLPELTE